MLFTVSRCILGATIHQRAGIKMMVQLVDNVTARNAGPLSWPGNPAVQAEIEIADSPHRFALIDWGWDWINRTCLDQSLENVKYKTLCSEECL